MQLHPTISLFNPSNIQHSMGANISTTHYNPLSKLLHNTHPSYLPPSTTTPPTNLPFPFPSPSSHLHPHSLTISPFITTPQSLIHTYPQYTHIAHSHNIYPSLQSTHYPTPTLPIYTITHFPSTNILLNHNFTPNYPCSPNSTFLLLHSNSHTTCPCTHHHTLL